jgi:hypothetical protein
MVFRKSKGGYQSIKITATRPFRKNFSLVFDQTATILVCLYRFENAQKDMENISGITYAEE